MKFTGAVEKIGKFNKILVSGPQRSGTTIAAKIISRSFELQYLDETLIKCWDKGAAADIIKNQSHFVLQCPGLSAWLQDLADPQTLVVFMLRSVTDIIDSEIRVKWMWQGEEYREYKHAFAHIKGYQYYKPISAHKLISWELYQRDRIKNYIELEYESLAVHPMFLPKSMRNNFKYKQTEV